MLLSTGSPPTGKFPYIEKPSFTDTIIPYSSNHPAQHKYVAIRFLHNRLNTYHLHKEEYNKEVNTIRGIMLNNEFPIHTHRTPTTGHPPTTPSDRKTGTPTQKWASFTHISKETTYITNLFKKTDLKIALRARSTIQKRLMQKHMTPDKYTPSGAYKLTCPDCDKAYIGQTGRSFKERSATLPITPSTFLNSYTHSAP